MAKNIVQDVVPGKRSIRDISIPPRRSSSSVSNIREIHTETVQDPVRERTMDIRRTTVKEKTRETIKEIPSDTDHNDARSMEDDTVLADRRLPRDYDFDYDVDRPVKKTKWGILALGTVFILALIFGVVSMFASAKVAIIPKSQTIPLQSIITAPKDQPAGQFGYQIVSVTNSVQKDVTAGADMQSDTKASGTIVIYNNSPIVQNLIATTRFSTSAGLIYRITTPVTVPKATVVAGKSTPGSATAVVTADQPGDKYNIGLSDFTLPGLQGTPRYTDIYARSKTTMTGGFSGIRKSVDTATLNQSTTDLQNSLKASLLSQIGAQLPQNFILFPSSVSYTFGEVAQQPSTDSAKATLSISGTASAVIFDRMLLSQKIIASVASTSAIDGQAEVQNISDLKFALTQPTSITKDYTGPISFQLTGDAKIVWLFDQAVLKADLIGMKKSALDGLLQAKYPSILQAQAKIFPMWKSTFPSDPNKITISQVDSF